MNFFPSFNYHFQLHIWLCSDKLVKLFNVKDRNGIDELDFSPLEGHTYAVNHVEFSKDGSLLATCSQDGCTTLWNPFVIKQYVKNIIIAHFN